MSEELRAKKERGLVDCKLVEAPTPTAPQLSLVMSLMVSFCAVPFSTDVLNEILDLIESVHECFPIYFLNTKMIGNDHVFMQSNHT